MNARRLSAARFTGAEHHQSYPGRMHGGVITAVMDEAIGRAIMIKYGDSLWGGHAELTMRFRRPVPLDVETDHRRTHHEGRLNGCSRARASLSCPMGP